MKPWIERKASKVQKMKQSIHDKIVCNLEDRLRQTTMDGEPFYSDIIKFEEYKFRGQVIGEMDLQAYTNNYFLLFEIKTTHSQKNRKHALEQLERAAEHYKRNFNRKKVYKFYVTKNRIEWIK